jgi:hypothetical protein
MSDDYISDAGPPIAGQSKRNTAGVNRYAVVDKKTSQALLQGRYSLSIKGAG